MSRVLQVLISSDFALFKKNDSNEFAITYNFPPKPLLLGLFGAVLGLSGYSKNEKKVEFYEKLKCFKIAVVPLDEDEQPVTEPPKKTIITYNNYHGYGSMESGGILQVREQLLIRPRYRIFILGNGKYYDELKQKLEAQEYFYTPYLGKNEFLAEVCYEGEKDALEIAQGNISITGVFLKDYCRLSWFTRENRNTEHFIVVEEYPVSFDEHYFYQKKMAICSDGVQAPDYMKIKEDGFEIHRIENQHLFFV